MAAYWLTYKPYSPKAQRGWPADRLRNLVQRFEADPATATQWWRIASHASARVGERVYLFKQGDDPRGVFGVGTIIAGPEYTDSPTDTDGRKHRGLIRFERLVDPGEGFLLRLDEIEDIVPLSMINAQASGFSVPDEIVPEIERRILLSSSAPTAVGSEQTDDGAFDPDSVGDARERAIRAIRMRRGQAAFRQALMAAYQGRCAITGCAVGDVLEAAHITPYLGPLTNHVSNGVLLRTDLHTLLDCDLIGIDPETRRVVVASALGGSSYEKLAGRALRRPADDSAGPSKKALSKRFAAFRALRGHG
jgi:hypothetical protein